MNWYYSEGQTQLGPVSEQKLIELHQAGSVTDDTLVWREGMANWAHYRDAGPTVTPEATAEPPATPAPPIVEPASDEAVCVECGTICNKSEMIPHGASYVCAACKPRFMQKLAEGARIGIPGRTTPFRYGGFWMRVGAKMLDSLILGAVVFLPMVVVMAVRVAAHPNAQEPDFVILFFQLGYYVLWGAYEVFFVGKYGATPGKMICRLRVVRPDNDRLTYGRATGRFFANFLSGIMCYVGYIMAGFDDEKRALHDRICDTRVVFKD
jgi:uncharacterized RDD family membrane protein YckC